MTVPRPAARSVNSTVAVVVGAAFVLAALAGFFVSDTFAERNDDALLGFEVNHLHNVVHLLIGLVLLAASRTTALARRANVVIGAVYLALGVVGWFVDDRSVNVLALNEADHVLHLGAGALLLAVGLAADRHARRRTAV